MAGADLTIEWSTLIALTSEDITKLKLDGVEGVYRVSKKEPDGKFYVVYIGSAPDLKSELLKLISESSPFQTYYSQGGDFSFRYAPLAGEEMRKAVEKQMYKQYAPRFNSREPISPLEVKANLN